MADQRQHSVSYDWGAVSAYRPDLRSHELVERARWFIHMRWLAVLACGGGAAAAALKLVPAQVEPAYFAAAAVFLAAANIVYTLVGRRFLGDEPDHRGIQILLVVQIIGDFISLSVLCYACGTIETPLLTLFMAHIILVTLFFGRLTSLAIVAAAWLFASLPLVLEWAGAVPTLSIFGGHFKRMVTANYMVTGGFVVGIGVTFFVCWYLVSEISAGLKLRERQLEETFEMLVRIDAEKTQATLRATHELKAPFAAIKSYVYILRDGYCGELPEKAQQVINRIGDRCDQLTSKITDIIHLSNLRTLVVTEMDLKPVNLTELISKESKEGALMGEPRGVKVNNLAEDGKPVYVMGSRSHLDTLFSNLIQNAVWYSHDGGEVEISFKRKARRVSVRIRDHGIGIPEKNLEKIFEEHFRSNNAVSHHPNGTGLGLPLVKEIVRLHGAVIHVDSEVGKGTHFTVSFDTTEPKQDGGEHG